MPGSGRSPLLEVGTPEFGVRDVEVGRPEIGRPPALADLGQFRTAGMRMKSAQLGDMVDMARSADIRSRRPARRQPAAPWYQDEAQVQDVAASLVSKGIQGAAAPGPGVVPYGALPESFRKAVGDAAGPIVGFDPSKLDKRERELLTRLIIANDAEIKARREAEARTQLEASAAPPGAFAGQMP